VEITVPTLTSVNYRFQDNLVECVVKYSVQGVIKAFDALQFKASDVIARNEGGFVSGSLEVCRAMCQEAMNMPIVLYTKD